MRLALAGLGGAAVRGHLPAIECVGSDDDVEIVAAADPDARRRAVVAAEQSRLRLFARTEAMLEAVEPDLLVIATEPSAHADLAALALARGIHVLCEKPVTLTRAEHRLLAGMCRSEPRLALVPVHQYRYSPTWAAICRWARRADRLGIPFTLDVEIDRDGPDPHAVTPWRRTPAAAGGMLADHGVHFLALGWTISEDLEVLLGSRTVNGDRAERWSAAARVGGGRLEISLASDSAARGSRVELRLPSLAFNWRDQAGLLTLAGRRVHLRRVDALSDRNHVDELYVPLYHDLVRNLPDPAWRRRRTVEALGVTSALITLLEIVAA